MKGGVGKTSLTANLAASLAQKLGNGRVSVLDLDPQNALHWHFDVDNTQVGGLCEWALGSGKTPMPLVMGMTGVRCCPYGFVDEADRLDFEAKLAHEPQWLAQTLAQMKLGDDAVVLLDTPPGPSVYLRQVVQCADLLLVVILPDGGSFLTIPAMETFLEAQASVRPDLLSAYVINQYDHSQELEADVHRMLEEDLGDRLCPIDIQRDDAVSDAVVFQKPVIYHAPQSEASQDMGQLGDWVLDVLNGV